MRKTLYLLMVIALLAAVAPAAVAAPPKAEGQAYTIQKDDWLWKLAEKYLGDPYAYPALALATNAKHAQDDSYALIWNMDLIEVGDKLWIPSAEEAQGFIDNPYAIQVETKDIAANNPFWASVWKGAEETADRWWVNLTLNAPTSEADVDVQIAQIEDAITKGVQGLVVAPTDASALNPAFDKAKAAGIPVLIIDSDTTWPDKLTFIGTNNKTGGKLGGGFICGELAAGDEVAIITGHMSAQSIADRVNGSKEAFAACGVEVVAELNGEHTREGGQTVMEDIITANPNIKAVFCANDNMALGAVEALKAVDKLAGVIVVGFDANPDAATSILAGEMTATIAQSSYNMGRFGVVYAVIAVQGNTIPELIDTGTTLVTAENAAGWTE